MSNPLQYRPLAPGESPSSDGSSSRGTVTSQFLFSAGPKRVSTACLACKKSKRKCSGVPPCDNCRASDTLCIFDESLDQRRRIAAKRTTSELNYYRDMHNDLFKVFRSADLPHALKLLAIIRGNNASPDEIQAYINETLTDIEAIEAGDMQHDEMVRNLEDTLPPRPYQSVNPSFRRKVMDVHYLCDDAPYKVPAKPWTAVTDDDDLVSHLVSLYFTWDYPFYGFLDKDIFIKYMAKGKSDSKFCNGFLVNALLANACHFSEFTESYVIPGDLRTKGADFLAEAERLMEDEAKEASLASLQGILLLHERYSMTKEDDLGYVMLHRAVRMGTSLGIIGSEGLNRVFENLSDDMLTSARRTAWGLFQLDTVIHTGFMKRNLVGRVNLDRFSRDMSDEEDLWIAYPTSRKARPSYMSQYYDEACNLCDIARDMSRSLFTDEQSLSSDRNQQQIREELFGRLRRWYDQLPATFDPSRQPPPHIITLRMRYYTLVINLFSDTLPDSVPSMSPDTFKSPDSLPLNSQSTSQNSLEITLAAAREISGLARLHRRDYGIARAHHFAMYAINLALFVMLQHPLFEPFVDDDFLSLCTAFYIIASRSALGRDLFRLFCQSVRAKAHGQKMQVSNVLSEQLKVIFDDEDKHPAESEEMDWEDSSRGFGSDKGGNLQESKLAIHEMLDQYEKMSLGSDHLKGPEKQASNDR